MYKIETLKKINWARLCKRPEIAQQSINQTLDEVFSQVRRKGDTALKKYTELFDGVSLTSFLVSEKEITIATKNLDSSLKKAIQFAKENIEKYHLAQQSQSVYVETQPGVLCWQEKRPIQKVGLYIPGGSAPLFSSVLMLAIPAKIATCKEVVLCTPPNKAGKINPAILYAATLCGITKIIKVGGIQAIAGMTFGTKSVPKVYKIFGPGNQYVTAAKQYATQYQIAVDMPAGPSELLIIADDSANANFVASDLLSQAEHGIDSQVLLVSVSNLFIRKVQQQLKKQLQQLPRKKIAEQALRHAKFIFADNLTTAIRFSNSYAPEHLILTIQNYDAYLHTIKNAGSVFIGNYTPESAGDYASGTNHTLPTQGYTKQYSGITVDAFTKSISFQKISKEGIQKIGLAIETMAEAEGLFGHKNAVSLRLKSLQKQADEKF